MGEVEGAPFLGAEREVEHVAPAQVEQVGLAFGLGLAQRLGDLGLAALDRDGARPGRARERAGELPEPRAHVQDALARLRPDLAQRGLVQQPVHAREATLLLGIGAVDVVRGTGLHGASATWRARTGTART